MYGQIEQGNKEQRNRFIHNGYLIYNRDAISGK